MKTISKKLLFLLLLLPLSVLAQSTVSGIVTDTSSGQPLPGVNVIIKGTTKGTTTDFDGKYMLSNVNSGEVIEFSYIGFSTQDIVYSSQSSINVSLVEESANLDEVVLVGYGTVKKRDATGSVAQVSSKDFNKGANVTAENLLNGKVAGVTINTSGAPGSGSEIRIRGGSSLLAKNDPLIIIDGLPISNSNAIGSTSILSSINPNDIESFSILKDASATAIYGSRASNGVIIINTKRGSKTLQVDYNFQYGTGRRANEVDVFSSQNYRDLVETNRPELASLLGVQDPLDPDNRIYYDTDWQDEIYRRTDFVDNNLSLKGNLFGVLPTRLSVGNTYQEGLRLTNAFTRNSVSLNLSPSLFKDHLKLRLSANYTNQRNRFTDAVEGSAIRFDPTKPVYDANSPSGGFFEYYNVDDQGRTVYANPSTANPVAQLLQTYDKGINNRIFGNFEIDYKFHFLPELRAVLNLGYDKSDGVRNVLRSTNARSGFLNNNISRGTNSNEEDERINSLLDFYLVYNKQFGKLNFEATAGYSYQKFERTGLRYIDFANNTNSVPQISFSDDDVVLLGYFGRVNFNYNDKYLLTLNYRRDGTSRFGPDNRFGNFPSVALGWKIKEDFFKESASLSELKLRVGWGVTGQQDIDESNFYQQIYTTGSPTSQIIINGQAINVGVSTAFGPIKWEETSTYNAGIDYGFYDNRLNGSLDVFYKESTDLLQTAPFADGSNFSNQGPQNIGSLNIKGIEFSVNYDLIKSENTNWNVGLNATKYERRIDEIALGAPILTGFAPGTGNNSQIFQEGFTPNSFYVYKQLYSVDGAPIEGAFADLNGDGQINLADRYIYKNSDPDLLIGFTTSFNYKNFDLSFNMRASVGNRVYNAVQADRSTYSNLLNGVPENISTNVLNTNFIQSNVESSVLSDMYIENGSYLRMDYATIGYTFNNWLGGKASVRLFSSVQNPFIITEYSGLDPEISGGIDNTIYPRQRQFLFGANVKF